MGVRTAVKPASPHKIAKHNLRNGLEHSEKMVPADMSYLNELLDCITTQGLATDYDLIGLKPNQREIKSPTDHPSGSGCGGARREYFSH